MKARLTCLALLFFLCLPVMAQEEEQEEEVAPPEFDVELIVFRHLTPDDSELRVYREEPEPDLDLELELVEEAEPEIKFQRFAPLQAEQLRLVAISDKLLSSRDWSPILHYGWRQPVLGRDEAPAVAIAGNRRGAYASGSVRVSVERFLRLELDVQMDPGTGILYTLDESRRLRSGQINYFDHPQFGIIVLVSKAEPLPTDDAI